MKKFLFIAILFYCFIVVSSFSTQPTFSQSCIPESQSCDQDHICCNFPDIVCRGGYCQPRTIICGKEVEPCCDLPNPACATNLECQWGYCALSITPTPTFTPTSTPTPAPSRCYLKSKFNACSWGTWECTDPTLTVCCCDEKDVCKSPNSCIAPLPTPTPPVPDCHCSWIDIGSSCATDDPSGCPAGTVPEITYCSNVYSPVCNCECIVPSGPKKCGETCGSDSECTGSSSCPKCTSAGMGAVGRCTTPDGTIPSIDIYGKCDKDKGEIDTAIGCIPTKNASAFIKWFLGRAILLAGGVAFLMMIAGALMVIVSSGNPERVKAGSQLITSAIAGLVFIIFSLFLLRLIGIELLALPGL